MSKASSSRLSRGTRSSYLDQQVRGTTNLALIGVDVIHVVTDTRSCCRFSPYMILGEDCSKTCDFQTNMLATIAGCPDTCAIMLSHVNGLINKFIAEGMLEHDYVVAAAAQYARCSIKKWQEDHPDKEFPSETLIVGWGEGLPSVYAVQDSKVPQVTKVHGDGFTLGSGAPHVLSYYTKEDPQPNNLGGPGRPDIQLAQIAKRAGVYAALNDRHSGDKVRYVEVRKDMIHAEDPVEVLKVLHDDYDMFKNILACFIFCIYRKCDFEYAADKEAMLSQAINTRFPSEIRRSHVLQTKEKYYIRVMQFENAEVAKEEFDAIKFEWRTECGIGHTIDSDVHPYVRALPWIELHQLQGTPLVFARAKKKCIAHFLKL